jgi:hypothetical protein
VPIETLLDLETIMVDELISRLKPSEERINHGNDNMIASLNLMEDKLVAWLSSCLKLSGGGGDDWSKELSSRGGKCGRDRGRGRDSNSGGRGGGDTRDHGGENACRGGGGGSSDVAHDECRYCGKKGHWARECKKKKCKEELHATQVEDEEESTLLLASATITELVTTPKWPVVHLDEGRLFVQHGDRECGNHSQWILDSSAMNHMIDEWSAFTKINNKVHGTILFGNGAVVNIEGWGTILIRRKTREHKVLVGVYLIPRFTANVVSLRQLEEDVHKIVLHIGFL